MKYWILVLLITISGCANSVIEETTKPDKKVHDEGVEQPQKLLYPTLNSFHKSIGFQNKESLETKPSETIFYDDGDAIHSINIASFYKTNKHAQQVLEQKRRALSKTSLLENIRDISTLKRVNNFRHKDIVNSEKIANLADTNKRRYKKLHSKFKKNWKDMSLLELQQFLILTEEDGNYTLAKKIRKFKCQKFPEACEQIDLQISGWVKSDNLEPVPGLKIQILNDPEIGDFSSDNNGEYNFSIVVYPHQLIRLRYSATGYMPLIRDVRIGSFKPTYESRYEIRMPKAKEVQSIPKAYVGGIETQAGSTYELKPGLLTTDAGESYDGEVQVYFYDFDPTSDDMGSVLQGSVRINDGVAQEGQLVSYGMPYAEFVDHDSNPLRISKKNPITITTKVQNMKYLYEKYKTEDQTEDEFWQYWIKYTRKKGGILSHGQRLNFTSYWVYNQETGIWDEVPLKVVSPGVVQSIFYTHN